MSSRVFLLVFSFSFCRRVSHSPSPVDLVQRTIPSSCASLTIVSSNQWLVARVRHAPAGAFQVLYVCHPLRNWPISELFSMCIMCVVGKNYSYAIRWPVVASSTRETPRDGAIATKNQRLQTSPKQTTRNLIRAIQRPEDTGEATFARLHLHVPRRVRDGLECQHFAALIPLIASSPRTIHALGKRTRPLNSSTCDFCSGSLTTTRDRICARRTVSAGPSRGSSLVHLRQNDISERAFSGQAEGPGVNRPVSMSAGRFISRCTI